MPDTLRVPMVVHLIERPTAHASRLQGADLQPLADALDRIFKPAMLWFDWYGPVPAHLEAEQVEAMLREPVLTAELLAPLTGTAGFEPKALNLFFGAGIRKMLGHSKAAAILFDDDAVTPKQHRSAAHMVARLLTAPTQAGASTRSRLLELSGTGTDITMDEVRLMRTRAAGLAAPDSLPMVFHSASRPESAEVWQQRCGGELRPRLEAALPLPTAPDRTYAWLDQSLYAMVDDTLYRIGSDGSIEKLPAGPQPTSACRVDASDLRFPDPIPLTGADGNSIQGALRRWYRDVLGLQATDRGLIVRWWELPNDDADLFSGGGDDAVAPPS